MDNLKHLNPSQRKLIKNYTSLITKIGKKQIASVLKFCSLFQSDNIELYEKFRNSEQTQEDIINLYAEMHGLDATKDIERICCMFYNNAINEGVSYHLNSSANFETIQKIGLGISLIGMKTEERKDKEKLQGLVTPEAYGKLSPWHRGETGNKVFYSNKPILAATYGDRPEWIKELRRNRYFYEEAAEEYQISEEAKKFINTILEKYDKKYSGKKRMLFLLPYLGKKDITGESPESVISEIYWSLDRNNEACEKYIPGSEIISVDLENYNLYILGHDGEIKTIDPNEQVKKYENQETKLSSEYEENNGDEIYTQEESYQDIGKRQALEKARKKKDTLVAENQKLDTELSKLRKNQKLSNNKNNSFVQPSMKDDL